MWTLDVFLRQVIVSQTTKSKSWKYYVQVPVKVMYVSSHSKILF